MPLINFYSLSRHGAVVNLFRLEQESDPVQRAVIVRQYRSYANLAESYSAIPSRLLAITHGISAVGKSSVAMRLVEALGALRFRSDFERKRLFGEQDSTQQNILGGGIYNPNASAATYQRLHALAADALQAGFPVVIDATYLKSGQRHDAWHR